MNTTPSQNPGSVQARIDRANQPRVSLAPSTDPGSVRARIERSVTPGACLPVDWQREWDATERTYQRDEELFDRGY